MAYFNVCQYCGATLDPSERCDCQRMHKVFVEKNATAPINTNQNKKPKTTNKKRRSKNVKNS